MKLLMRASDRNNLDKLTKMDYYDENFKSVKINWGYTYNENPTPLPENIFIMKELAEKLSKGLNELRVDLYTDTKNIYFGELTFFDGAGFDKIEPVEWDYKLGSYITII